MDSLTQALLGAAVGEATLGRKVGNKAALWGAALGTLPDLDVLYPFADPVSAFTWHRGPSHSILVLALVTPLFVGLIRKFHPSSSDLRAGWYRLVLLVFGTHVLLDCFTAYGTQALWPLPMPPIQWATIFIIDPLYTVPLMIGLIGTGRARHRSERPWRWNHLGLIVSTLYLAWSAGAKLYADREIRSLLAVEGQAYDSLQVQATPFNTLLWRVVGVDGDRYFEGYWSLLSPTKGLSLTRHSHEPDLLAGIQESPAVQRLQWFTVGLYRVRRDDKAVILTDLRMGTDPDYIFAFEVAERSNPHSKPVPPKRLPSRLEWSRLGELWDRL